MVEGIITTLIFASIMWLLGFSAGFIRGTRETIKETKKKYGSEEWKF